MALRQWLAWGLVGGLSFLVLVQAYELVAGVRVGVAAKAGIALAVTGGAGVLTATLARRVGDGRS